MVHNTCTYSLKNYISYFITIFTKEKENAEIEKIYKSYKHILNINGMRQLMYVILKSKSLRRRRNHVSKNRKQEKTNNIEISAVILSGGKSTRMGQDKAGLILDGQTFLAMLEENLAQADEILLSVREKSDYPEYLIKHVTDRFPGCGPLAGIHTAMEVCRNPILFVVSCDMPFVDMELVNHLLPYLTESVDAVVPVEKSGKKHVLCALYRRSIKKIVEAQLKSEDYKVQHILEKIRVCYVAVEGLCNINTPQDYQKLENMQTEKDMKEKEGVSIPIYSIVAYSGTGKTTFLEKLLPELKKRGLRVAVVKHDAHEFEIDREGKDSDRITKAGADITGLISAKKAVLMENRPIDFEQMVQKIEKVDIILTEGFKHGNWPKIMLYRKAAGKPLAMDPKECIAVVSDVEIQGCEKRFQLDDAAEVAEFLAHKIKERKEENGDDIIRRGAETNLPTE